MVGEVRRFSGSVSVPKKSTVKVTILAAEGEVVKLTTITARMNAGSDGSWVELRITGGSIIKRESNGSPNLVWEGEFFIDDTNGIELVAYNAYFTDPPKPFYYAAQGVKIN